MKVAGKRAGLMPPTKEAESAAEDKGENEVTESKTVNKKAMPAKKKKGGLMGFMAQKMPAKLA